MTIRITMIKFALAATAIAVAPGCDSELSGLDHGLERIDGSDFSFRNGPNCDPRAVNCGGLLNTSVTGHNGEYRLDNIPLIQGSDPYISVENIIAYECISPGVGPLFGTFRAVAPDLTLDDEGNFGPTVFEDVTMAGETCIVQGEMFTGSEWYLKLDHEVAPGQFEDVDIKLRIEQMTVLPGQHTQYYWQSDLAYLDGDPTTSDWQYICDLDQNAPFLNFRSVMYEGLRINEATGLFENDPTTAFSACSRASVAKSGEWGYYEQSMDIHQAASYATIARYCGRLEASYTEFGVDFTIMNLGNGPHQEFIELFDDETWIVESGVRADGTAACVYEPRMNSELNHTPGQDFDCGNGTTIPACTPQSLGDPSIVLFTYALR